MNRVNCPCCGFPTFERKGYDEICMLCDWQDDSIDDAKKVWGGPNGDYSLEEARNNFQAFFIMYRENEINEAEWELLERKKELIKAYESLLKKNDESAEEKWKRVVELEQEFYVAKYGNDEGLSKGFDGKI